MVLTGCLRDRNFVSDHILNLLGLAATEPQLKARANARNIVGPNMLRAFAHHVVCCCVLLRLVGSCWMKFETGQTSEPTSAFISILSRSWKRGPTMLRSFARQHGVGDGKRPRVLCILI